MSAIFGVEFPSDPGATVGLPEVARVEVREALGEMITYTLAFAEDVCDHDFQLLKHKALMPNKEVAIWVEADERRIYLVKGPIKGQQIKIVNGGQGSELQVTGTDNSVRMKQLERKENHKDEKDSDIVREILSRNGFESPNVIDFGLQNDDAKHSRLQNQDDLSFLKNMASDQGVYLWITYDKDGTETVNFGELPLTASPSVKLIVNHDDPAMVNIESLSINWDADVPTKIVGSQLDTKNKRKLEATVEGPEQHKLGSVTLAELTKDYPQQAKSAHKPADDSGRVQQRSKGALHEAEFFIKASCSTSFDAYCDVIHAHTIAEVIGAGSRHSGYYVVSGVTHTIDASSHKMQIELLRNAFD